MLNDQPTLVGARTTVSSALLRVARSDVRRLMTLIGHEGEAETLKLQRFLRRNGYPHQVTSVKAYQSASLTSSLDQDSGPAVVFNDGRVLHRPTVPRLADELGISEMPDESTIYDVIATEVDRGADLANVANRRARHCPSNWLGNNRIYLAPGWRSPAIDTSGSSADVRP
jgi:hypothetical protein